jgi:uroporphyrinogen decarboxylase
MTDSMTSRQRLLAALDRRVPDCLPVTNHFVMPYFLDNYMDGISEDQFWTVTGLDPILWTISHRPDPSKGEYYDPGQTEIGFLESRRIASDDWRIEAIPLSDSTFTSTRYNFITPGGTLSMVLQSNDYTAWVAEHLIKEKKDIEILGKYMTHPKCNVEDINRQAAAWGDRGIVRGWICCFDIFGQPGTWQDACCLRGTEGMILAAIDDPGWAHELLKILCERKKTYIRSLKGAHYDVHELGGGTASDSVISPKLFDQFVAPYDSELIQLAHEAGQRISYHTCGGMMRFLERVADMGPNAMETFTPSAMGGNANLKEAKRRIGDRVCMIGGFDQFHFLKDCPPELTRAEVRRCFEEAGAGGGYILCTSDNYFDADPELLKAFADEAHHCAY